MSDSIGWQGRENPAVMLCGHSHRYAMLSAISGSKPIFDGPAAVLSQPPGQPHVDVGDDYFVKAATAAPIPLVILWRGNFNNNNFLFVPASGCVGFHREPQPSGPLVPEQLARAYFESLTKDFDPVLTRLCQLGRVIVAGTPPTKRNHIVRGALQKSVPLIEFAKRLGLDPAKVQITPESFRVATWAIYQAIIAEKAAAHGATFLPVPESVQDKNGCMRDEFATEDASHANANYGAIMWRAIFEHLSAH